MSQPSDITQSEYNQEYAAAVFSSRVTVAVGVLLPLYEFIITFDQEVSMVWLRDKGLSGSSVLLVSTRWAMVLLAILSTIIPTTSAGCMLVGYLVPCLSLLAFFQVAVFSSLRISAIWGRSQILLVLVFILGLAPLITDAYSLARTSMVFGTVEGCSAVSEISDGTTTMLVFTARIPLIIADALVLVLTFIKTYGQVIRGRRAGVKVSLSTCLLRDGALYFVVFLVLNLTEILTHRTSSGAQVSQFVASIPPILLNRFMLNLRQLGTMDNTGTLGGTSGSSTIQFHVKSNSIFGNFGEPLEHGQSLGGGRRDWIDDGPAMHDDENGVEDAGGVRRVSMEGSLEDAV